MSYDKRESGLSAEQAERNNQLIENLMARMQRISAKAAERRKACEEDQKADSDMCSAKITTLQQEMEERDGESMVHRKPTAFSRESESGLPDVNVRFRAPMTEAGKQLDAVFEEKLGHLLTSSQKRNSRARAGSTSAIARGRRNGHKIDEKKLERINYERRLQSNLESYVARSVNELRYRISSNDTFEDEDCSRRNQSGSQRELQRAESWPIPVESHQMNPRLLLAYSCQRIVLPSGDRLFKHFVLSQISCEMYINLYWFAHCRFYQNNSELEQHYLLRRVALLYVKLLSLEALETHRDFFFKYFPYVMANAIFYGFYYLCPGSRHLYTASFKKILFLQLAQILTGVDVSPLSVDVLRQQCFPEDTADEVLEGDTDTLPPLPIYSPNNAEKDVTGHWYSDAEKNANGLLSRVQEDDDGNSILQSCVSASLLANRVKPECIARHQSMPVLHQSNALAGYIGNRGDLRFRPLTPAKMKSVLPRQKKVAFDTNQLSPLLQEYLANNPQNNKGLVRRTTPVRWCFTGGTDTFIRFPAGKDAYESIRDTYLQSKLAFRQDMTEIRHSYNQQLKRLDKDMKQLQERGAVAIGHFALDRVVLHST